MDSLETLVVAWWRTANELNQKDSVERRKRARDPILVEAVRRGYGFMSCDMKLEI
jgi:hypothetical protein